MILSTDSTANLPSYLYKDLNISMIPMQINLNNKTYNDLSPDLLPETFYKTMQEGIIPTTSQINEYCAKEYFTNLLKNGEDVLHISFSSALSGSTATIIRVAEELNKTNSNKITKANNWYDNNSKSLLAEIKLYHDVFALTSKDKCLKLHSKAFVSQYWNIYTYIKK